MRGITDTVVIVGGGVAGGALANVLIDGGPGEFGLRVIVLEQTDRFRDRVRGELLQVWGVKEARRCGLGATLDRAGAVYNRSWMLYSRYSKEPGEIAMNLFDPSVAGSVSVGHPQLCQALLDRAVDLGTEVVRGATDITVEPGDPPTVSWVDRRGPRSLRPDLVVGADGRRSLVRRSSSLVGRRREATSMLTGLLVEGLGPIDPGVAVTASDEDLYLLLFPQTAQRARAYLCTGLAGRSRFAGVDGAGSFLQACAGLPMPWADRLAAGTVAGPCGGVLTDAATVADPTAPGVVLIGDAAGHSNPILGQGLACAFRDARMVGQAVLEGARQPAHFDEYRSERFERMERIHVLASIVDAGQAEDCDDRAARHKMIDDLMTAPDGRLPAMLAGAFAGPETIPSEAFDPSMPDRIRAAG